MLAQQMSLSNRTFPMPAQQRQPPGSAVPLLSVSSCLLLFLPVSQLSLAPVRSAIAMFTITRLLVSWPASLEQRGLCVSPPVLTLMVLARGQELLAET